MRRFIYLLPVFILFAIKINATNHLVTSKLDNATDPVEGMLRYAVENASNGDTITFNVDTVRLDQEIRIDGGIITIDGGNGVILDGNNQNRILNISCYSSSDNIIIRNLTFQNGRTESSLAMGGGMYAYIMSGNLEVDKCTFKNNVVVSNADGQGGALRTRGGTFTNCFFLNNEVSGTGSSLGGGGIYSIGGIFINCVIAGNSSKYGGGIYSSTSSEYINCTVTQNSASNADAGGGVNSEDNCKFTNCILYNNQSAGIENNIYNYLNSSSFSYCAVENANSIVGSSDNIGLTNSPFTHTGTDSLSILQNSDCYNMGTSSNVTVLSKDIIGNKRIQGNSIDIGAYEYNIPLYSTITVTNNSFDLFVNNSLAWALEHADSACIINFDNNYHIDVTEEILIKESITIDGTGYAIELDGAKNNRIFQITDCTDGDTITFKNLLIQNGYNQFNSGSGIYSRSNGNIHVEIINCAFENNDQRAVYMENAASFLNCTFYNNNDPDHSGAVAYITEKGEFINCLFYKNFSKGDMIDGGEFTFSYCASNTILPGYKNVLLLSSPINEGVGADRLYLNSSSYCANAGTPDISQLNIPSKDLAGNLRIINDTIDIGAYESNYFSTPPRPLYKNITVTNNSFDNSVENSLLWALEHADDSCIITFDNDYTINVGAEIFLGNKSLTIDGGLNNIILDGGGGNRIINFLGDSLVHVKLKSLNIQNGYAYTGGGLLIDHTYGGDVSIHNCLFKNNRADNWGGAIHIIHKPLGNYGTTIINSVFRENKAAYGGGVYNAGVPYSEKWNSFINCTFTKNEATNTGAATYCYGNNKFYNCLFYDNIVQEGQSTVINGETKFCAADSRLYGENNVWLHSSPFIDGSFELNDHSFCSNAGTPDTTGMGLDVTDFAGNNRIINDTIDIGAFESNYFKTPEPELYESIIVKNNAFDVFEKYSLLWAMVHIKDGGTITFDNDYTINVSKEIILGEKNLVIDGGENRIILDGGDSTRLFIVEGNSTKVKLINLTMQNGYAQSGGAILSHPYQGCKIYVINCMFYKNSSLYRGGAIASENRSVYLYNCNFIENSTTGMGGAVYAFRDGNYMNCSFSNNHATNQGGGVYTFESTFVNSMIYGNSTNSGFYKDIYDIMNSTTYSYCASGDNISSYGDDNLLLTEDPFIASTNLYDSLMLKQGSVLINAGNPDTTGLDLPAFDFRNKLRIASDTIDIGAYEYYDYIISSTAHENGIITPEKAYVISGRDQKMSIRTDTGFIVDSVWVDDIYVDSVESYTFYNVIADHTIEATFKLDSFNIFTEVGENGIVTPGDTIITYFDTVQYAITPDIGYKIDTAVFADSDISDDLLKVDGTSYFTVDSLLEDETLRFSFSLDTFNIITEVSEGGIVSPGDTMITYFDTVQYVITPGVGYKLDSVLLGNNNMLDQLLEVEGSYLYTIDSLLHDDTLHVVFCPDTFNITTIANGNGTIDPMNFEITYFDRVDIRITPESGYRLCDAAFGRNDIMSELAAYDTYFVFTIEDILHDDTLEVNFAQGTFHIHTVVEGMGTVTPADTTVSYGEGVFFYITPHPDYDLDSITYSDVDIFNELGTDNNSYTYYRPFITSDDTLYAKFEDYSTNIIEGFNKEDINIFPNPTEGKLFIKRPIELTECNISLFDMSGKSVSYYPEFKDDFIDVHYLPSGNYILLLEYQGQKIGFSIIKK